MTTVFAILTPNDIAWGEPRSCDRCPLALAITRALRTVLGRPVVAMVARSVRVMLCDVTVSCRPGEGRGPVRRTCYFDVPLPPEAMDFVDWFDRLAERVGEPTGPVVVPVEIPDDLPPPDRRLAA